MSLNKILIIEFGSQFTLLIARRVREQGIYSEIVSHKKKLNCESSCPLGEGFILTWLWHQQVIADSFSFTTA